jgi:hypothetical protein
VEKVTDREFKIEKLTPPPSPTVSAATMREGSPAEVLVPLTLPEGTTTLVLEYQW